MRRKATVFLLPVWQVERSVIHDKYFARMRADGTYARWLTVLYDVVHVGFTNGENECSWTHFRVRLIHPTSGQAVPHYLSCRRYSTDGAGFPSIENNPRGNREVCADRGMYLASVEMQVATKCYKPLQTAT